MKESTKRLVIGLLKSAVQTLTPLYPETKHWFSCKHCHWTASKASLVKKLKRQLDSAEISLLSLSVNYGPCPLLPDAVRDEFKLKRIERYPEKPVLSPKEVLEICELLSTGTVDTAVDSATHREITDELMCQSQAF